MFFRRHKPGRQWQVQQAPRAASDRACLQRAHHIASLQPLGSGQQLLDRSLQQAMQRNGKQTVGHRVEGSAKVLHCALSARQASKGHAAWCKLPAGCTGGCACYACSPQRRVWQQRAGLKRKVKGSTVTTTYLLAVLALVARGCGNLLEALEHLQSRIDGDILEYFFNPRGGQLLRRKARGQLPNGMCSSFA